MLSFCLICEIPEKYADIAFAFWYERGMLGCEEELCHGGMRYKVYFNNSRSANDAASDLQKVPSSNIKIVEIEEQDWNAKWRQSMKPAKLSRTFWVSPTWLPPPQLRKGDHWIKIEPKMAFGTGHHETTRLAAQSLIRNKKKVAGSNLLDVGTGSGILCFVAGICGSSRCIGIEIDRICRENCAENLRDNNSAGTVSFIIGRIESIRRRPIFDVAVMNMLLTESLPQLKPLSLILKDRAMMIWSGILTEEKNTAIDAAAGTGFVLSEEKSEHEWWCGTFLVSK
jgi:ribosomal protein L11 methyltransferase